MSVDANVYINGLGESEKQRYKDKLQLLGGTDPYEVSKWSSDVSLLPSVTYIDIVNYLLWTPSKYTKDDMKSYKGLEAYNQFINGWVRERSAVECSGYIVVTAKVLHSQRLREKPLRPWVAAEKAGTIVAAHCNCMAGLGEACTHIAALLFAVDATVRIRESKTVTDEKAYWLLPSDMKKVKYDEVRYIDFTSAATAKRKFEQTLDSTQLNTLAVQTPKVPRDDKVPEATDDDMNELFQNLAQANPTSVILSIVEPHCDRFIPKVVNGNFPQVLTELKDENCYSMTRAELIEHCKDVGSTITCDAQQRDAVESTTREQTKSKSWNTFRAGRITASKARAACSTDPTDPSPSLIKNICYPGTTGISTDPTRWGNDHENNALKGFELSMQRNHEDALLETSGFIISTSHAYIGASPDGIFSCNCCGQATVEVKCPFKHRNEDLDKCDYLVKDENGEQHLKVNHAYYYQVQTQLGCSGMEFGYFVVWTPTDLHIEQILFDQVVWDRITSCAGHVFNNGVLPELVGKYYSRLPSLKRNVTLVPPADVTPKTVLTPLQPGNSTRTSGDNSSCDTAVYCHCQRQEFGKMIACDNQNCKFEWFHYECVGIKRKPRGDWFCRDCLQ